MRLRRRLVVSAAHDDGRATNHESVATRFVEASAKRSFFFVTFPDRHDYRQEGAALRVLCDVARDREGRGDNGPIALPVHEALDRRGACGVRHRIMRGFVPTAAATAEERLRRPPVRSEFDGKLRDLPGRLPVSRHHGVQAGRSARLPADVRAEIARASSLSAHGAEGEDDDGVS
jgi:hypothetical protein